MTKNADINKYKNYDHGIRFDRHGSFSFLGTGLGRNVIIFRVDMSSSMNIDNSKNNVLILGKGPTQGLEHTLSAEKMYLINFTEHEKSFRLGLHSNGTNSYLFANDKEINNSK